jgi:hypothetical protein
MNGGAGLVLPEWLGEAHWNSTLNPLISHRNSTAPFGWAMCSTCASRFFFRASAMYLDRKDGFYFACIVMIAIGALAYYAVVAPIARALGLF